MSRRSFATMIDLPEGTLRNYEHGTSQPKFDALCQISQKTNVSLDWLVFGREEHKESQAIQPGACQQCVELYAELVIAQKKIIQLQEQSQEQKEALLKENGELKAVIAGLQQRPSLSTEASGESTAAKTA